MDKIYKKIESYLHREFPNKSLIRCAKLTDPDAEVYGTMSLQIKVVEKANEVFYQLVLKK